MGSLWHPSGCIIEYADVLLVNPFVSVFSGSGGGVLDGEEEDRLYNGGNGGEKCFPPWTREEDESESPFSRIFSRWLPRFFLALLVFGSLSLDITLEFDNNDLGSFVWLWPFLLIMILVFVFGGLGISAFVRIGSLFAADTRLETPVPLREIPFGGATRRFSIPRLVQWINIYQ